MPRLTTPEYLSRHYQLKELWIQNQYGLGHLTYKDKIALHKYHLPTLDKTKTELLEHHRNVQFGEPSLPQRAGRAYAKLARGQVCPRRPIGRLAGGRYITVRAIARPEPDLKMIAKAAWQIALREADKEQARRKLSRYAIPCQRSAIGGRRVTPARLSALPIVLASRPSGESPILSPPGS